jgi:IclR family transcriptional regulator, pca regulon regulatory protein
MTERNISLVQRDGEFAVGSLARGLHLMSCLANAHRELGLSELAQLSGLDKATTFRLASTLVKLRYIAQDDVSRRYRLGLNVLDLGFAYLASLDVRAYALPRMEALVQEFEGSSSLTLLDGADIVYIERLVPHQPRVSVHVQVGSRLPAHCSSMGKALLALLPQPELRRLLDTMRLDAWTERTITDRRELLRQLDQVRCLGFAINDEETALGLRSVAAAIRDRKGRPAAALNVAVSAAQLSPKDLAQRVGPRVLEEADMISRHLGWMGA